MVEKIKKGLMEIGVFLSLLPSKVFAISDSMMRISPMYGIQEPEPVRSNLVNNIWNVCYTNSFINRNNNIFEKKPK